MILKNLTDTVQEIKIKELLGDHREYSIYLNPHSTTELDRLLVLAHPADLRSNVEIVGLPPVVEAPVAPQIPTEIETPDDKESKVEEIKTEDVAQNLPDRFICDECGNEFASARALTIHKNKSHNH